MSVSVKESIYEMLEKISDEKTLMQVKDDITFYASKQEQSLLTTQDMDALQKAIEQADKNQVINWVDFKQEMEEWKKKS
ncbi:MAG: hypothetical protein ACKO13_06865 [Cytophagales bacterium]